jgi:6-phosphogluconolactonase (cycloisomerase 2 family)
MVFHILVASYTDEVYTLQFDPQSSSLRLISTVKVGQNPSWITPHPDDRSLIFTALEQPQGKIVLLKYSTDGIGQVIAEVSSGGSSPCAMHATTDELFIANVRSLTPYIFIHLGI